MCFGSCGLPTFFISKHSRGLSKGRALPEWQGTRQDLQQLCSSAVRASPPTWDMYVSRAGNVRGISLRLAHYTKNFQTLWVNKLLLTLKCLFCLDENIIEDTVCLGAGFQLCSFHHVLVDHNLEESCSVLERVRALCKLNLPFRSWFKV